MKPWEFGPIEPDEGDPQEVVNALNHVALDLGDHTDVLLHWLPTEVDGRPIAVVQPVTMHVHGRDCARA